VAQCGTRSLDITLTGRSISMQTTIQAGASWSARALAEVAEYARLTINAIIYTEERVTEESEAKRS
jgi:plasmid maintenance system antidote protein VapI